MAMRVTKMPPPAMAATTRARMVATAPSPLTPSPMKACERALAMPMARWARNRLVLAPTKASASRGSSSLTA